MSLVRTELVFELLTPSAELNMLPGTAAPRDARVETDDEVREHTPPLGAAHSDMESLGYLAATAEMAAGKYGDEMTGDTAVSMKVHPQQRMSHHDSRSRGAESRAAKDIRHAGHAVQRAAQSVRSAAEIRHGVDSRRGASQRCRSAPPRRPMVRNANVPQERPLSPKAKRMQECRRAYGGPVRAKRNVSRSHGELTSTGEARGQQQRKSTQRLYNPHKAQPKRGVARSLESQQRLTRPAPSRGKPVTSSLDAALHATIAVLTADPFHARATWR